ncbi:MAG: DUF2075 domain-containing protein [Puniceicoccaceae bacterium]
MNIQTLTIKFPSITSRVASEIEMPLNSESNHSEPNQNNSTHLSRAWFSSSISDFIVAKPFEVLGELTKNSTFSVDLNQRDAWLGQIAELKSQLREFNGSILLEYSIPRMGSRIDAVVLTSSLIFILEFKVGESSFEGTAIDQAWDYALDLKNFHEGSHNIPILPILIATGARSSPPVSFVIAKDSVYKPVSIGSNELKNVMKLAFVRHPSELLDQKNWLESGYQPTPTIVEAARNLYSRHSVEAIARSDAGAKNLASTSSFIEELVDKAKQNKQKIICFVTGVPGAGKTLVGLNVATRKSDPGSPTHAVFLSGNDPLVEVLVEALTRDEFDRRKIAGEKVRKGDIKTRVRAFIQKVHHFRDEGLIDNKAPADHIVIFDEAQRAWNLEKTSDFMKRRKGITGFDKSEPEFLISYLNRHQDWALIVCLVGGGQEIHTGEAGIGAWLEAVNCSFPDWKIFISNSLKDREYAAGNAIQLIENKARVETSEELHLSVSMRSFRAENVSDFVKAVLDKDQELARNHLLGLVERYPIALTRSLACAKSWIRGKARGSERSGILASSKAMRLKPHAIDIRASINPIHWFLNGKDDTRSSYYLEDAATEFQVQGLEVDWACVSWDADLRFVSNSWSYHDFKGTKWNNVRKKDNQKYLLNAYRVLLTRARQGMVIFVPQGDPEDPTRNPEFYDSTYAYLMGLGIPVIN